jgi:ceramide glucosyltransferase
MTAWTAVRDAVLALALAPLAYYFIALIAAARFFRGNTPASAGLPSGTASSFTPPVSILKPIRGLDRETYENYASFCRQEYPEFEILFCVTDASDPAIPVIEQVIHDFSGGDVPRRSIRLLTGSEPVGASDKVNKLCRMVREARHDIVLVSDSDVRVEPGFLRAVTAPFHDPKVGGVTCLYRGLTDRSFAANLEALGNSTDFAPGVLVAGLGGSLNFMLGAVMATTKKHLAEIGGFESLADFFCDDYELGNRIAARGYRVELSRFPVDIVYPHETLREAFRHQLRWNLSIRYSRPGGHFGLIFAQGLPWALLAAAIAPSPGMAAGYVAVYALLRAAVAWVTGVRGMQDRLARSKMWMLPLRDAFAFVVWCASFFPQRIHWRDREFYVRAKRLVPAPPRHP